MRTMLSTRMAGDVAVVVLDQEGDRVNMLTTELGQALEPVLEGFGQDPACIGVVIISGKEDCFIAGADIDQLAGIRTAAEGEALSRTGHRMLDKLAKAPKPVVAAIHGSCLGGGLELAMACQGRVASDDARVTKLGLPEIQLGLIPGAGGTQRLPRLVGVQDALDMILTGKMLRPKKAVKLGLVDEVVPRTVLEQAAVKRVRALAAAAAAPRSSASHAPTWAGLRRLAGDIDAKELLLSGNPLGRRFVFHKAAEMVQRKTRGHYPAAFAALRAIQAGLERGEAHGLEVEAREFGELLVSDVSRRLVELYHAVQAIKKDKGVPEPAPEPVQVNRLTVLGGGLMGSGIAYVSAEQGVQVRIKEQDPASAAKALSAVHVLVAGQQKRRRLTRPEAEVMMSRVAAGPDLVGLRRCELVIEAVFEDLDLKQRLIREVEAQTTETCVIASNTSSLPIHRIAEAASRPHNILGMHFFSPVHKMPLLEVIVGQATSAPAVVTAVAYGKRLGKQVIVVRDGVGFYTSRILAPYLNEASFVLTEGGAVDAIDEAMVDWGFPVGPIALMDEVGIDVGERVGRIMIEAFGERMAPPPGLEAIAADGRKGRKNQRGFYVYETGKKAKKVKKKQVDISVYSLLPGGPERRPIDVPEVQQRLGLRMVNEALHCLGEGILRNARDGNIGAIFGLGFPPFLGGPLRYVDQRGAKVVLDDLNRLRDRFGLRFEPAPALVDAARANRRFCD